MTLTDGEILRLARDGGITAKELAKKTQVTPVNAAVRLARLQGRGVLLRRKLHETDGKKPYLYLPRENKELLAEIQEMRKKLDELEKTITAKAS